MTLPKLLFKLSFVAKRTSCVKGQWLMQISVIVPCVKGHNSRTVKVILPTFTRDLYCVVIIPL